MLMASIVKMAAADSAASLYDLEYRDSEDGAWYSACVIFDADADAEALTVKYLCSPEVHETFSAWNFRTVAQVEELVARFRPVSLQVQDNQCLRLSIGTTVCAAHGTGDDDLRFYDAVVEEVEHRPHSFAGGEEECLCSFLLFWKHGRGCGTLTSVNIASICILDSAFQIDPRISAFAKMAKKKIATHGSLSKGRKNRRSSMKNDLELSPKRPRESETSERLESLTNETKDNQWTNQDEDMGPISRISDDSAAAGKHSHFFILINNLEKDLNPLTIKDFIYEKTTIIPEACVFPSRLTDPFARGAIMVDSLKKAQTVEEYLDNTNHLIVSSRGRPWVITEKASAGIFTANIWNFIRMSQEEIKHERTHGELQVVVSGTESYKRAKKLRDLTVEFLHHESEVSKELVSQENKILCSLKPSIAC